MRNFSLKSFATAFLLVLAGWLAFCLWGCSAEKHLANFLERHPEFAKDTSLLDYDTTTFYVPLVRKDSVVHISSFMHDTIFLKQDRLTMKTYVYNDSVYIEGECDEIRDTVFSVERIPYKQIVYPEEQIEWWKWLLAAFILYLFIKEIIAWRSKRGSSQ